MRLAVMRFARWGRTLAVATAAAAMFATVALAQGGSAAVDGPVARIGQVSSFNSFRPTWSANHLGTLGGLIHWNPRGMVATPVMVRNAPPRPFPSDHSWYPPGGGIPPRFAPVAPTQFGPWAATYQLAAPPPDLGFRGTTASGQGIVVDEVTPGGPADQMGLKAGDVIVRVNSRAIRRGSDLYAAICNSSGPARVIVRDAKSGRFEQLDARDLGGDDTAKEQPTEEATEPAAAARSDTPADVSRSAGRKWPRPRPLVKSTSADPHPISAAPAKDPSP